jgi:hypothetical protein
MDPQTMLWGPNSPRSSIASDAGSRPSPVGQRRWYSGLNPSMFMHHILADLAP